VSVARQDLGEQLYGRCVVFDDEDSHDPALDLRTAGCEWCRECDLRERAPGLGETDFKHGALLSVSAPALKRITSVSAPISLKHRPTWIPS